VKSLLFGSDLGQAGDWGGFDQNREVIYLGQLEAFTKEIHRFRNFYAEKNGGLDGRSVGIRTRGLLDPNSVRGENRRILRPLSAITCIFAKGSKLLCPRRPTVPIAFWVRVWVSGIHHSAKVGVLGTSESDSFFGGYYKSFPHRNPITVGRIDSIPLDSN